MISVVPLAATGFVWNAVAHELQECAGRKCTVGVDTSNKQVSLHLRYLSALDEFRAGKPSHPFSMLRSVESQCLRSLHFTFLFHGISTYQLSMCGLTVLPEANNSGMLVSGTLDVWRTAILEVLTTEYHETLKEAFIECLRVFESLGFSNLWHAYRKTATGLELRK